MVRDLSAALLIGVCGAGCASQARVEEAATMASDRLAAVQKAIKAKVKAENRYYDHALKLTNSDLGRWRTDGRTFMLQERRDAYIAKNTGKNATTQARELVTHMEGTIAAWRTTEAEREQLQAEIMASLASSRQKINLETKKIAALRGKLSALGKARDNKALLQFINGYARQVKDAVDALEEDAAKAPEASKQTEASAKSAD